MNKMISLILEASLRSALEAHATQARMDAEGRTELNEADEKALRDATDAAAEAARAAGNKL